MAEKKDKNRVLQDHRKEGKKLIPPLPRLLDLKEISFQDSILPDLVWVSTIFLRNTDKQAVETIITFLEESEEILKNDQPPPLIFLSSFDKLSCDQKTKIVREIKDKKILEFLRNNLAHQQKLLSDYPLGFIFNDQMDCADKEEALKYLREDVSALLDRCSFHSTKVQTTAIYSMGITGKLRLTSNITPPDLNSIFTSPESDESKRAAAFARSVLTAQAELQNAEGREIWSNKFWKQCFSLEACS